MSFVPPPAPTGTSFDSPRPTEPAPLPPTIAAADHIYRETVPGGAMASLVVRRGHTLRLTALEAGANVGMVCYHRANALDRYNMADTLKAQHTAKLTAGYVLLTDMGRALFSITGDTLGWHDPLGGHDNAALVASKWGGVGFQDARNRYQRNAHDSFLIELGKWGLGRRDLVANINWFSKVAVDAAGRLAFVPSHARTGDCVDLRAELDVLVVLNTCQHPMDPGPYAPRPVQLDVWRAPVPGPDDYCRNYRPENARALWNSEVLGW